MKLPPPNLLLRARASWCFLEDKLLLPPHPACGVTCSGNQMALTGLPSEVSPIRLYRLRFSALCPSTMASAFCLQACQTFQVLRFFFPSFKLFKIQMSHSSLSFLNIIPISQSMLLWFSFPFRKTEFLYSPNIPVGMVTQ